MQTLILLLQRIRIASMILLYPIDPNDKKKIIKLTKLFFLYYDIYDKSILKSSSCLYKQDNLLCL